MTIPIDQLQEFDFEYAELQCLSLDIAKKKCRCEILIPRDGWYWTEIWNQVKSLFGVQKIKTGAVLSFQFEGINRISGNLVANIESLGLEFPIEVEEFSLEQTGNHYVTLSLQCEDEVLEFSAATVKIL